MPRVNTPRRTQPGLAWAIALTLLAIGASLLYVRAVSRMHWIGTNMDAGLVTIGGRVWARGQSPYDTAAFAQAWLDAGGPPDRNPAARGPQAMVYPPAAYMLGAPIGLLPLDAARAIWNWMNVAILVAGAAALIRAAGLGLRTPWGVGGLGLALAMAPAHTNIFLGQTAVIVFGAVAAAISLRHARRPWFAGLALAVSCCIKPQIGLLFLVYELARGRWRIALSAGIAASLLMAAAIVRLRSAGIDPIPQWLENIHALTLTDANPLDRDPDGLTHPHRLINLSSPIAVMLGESALNLSRVIGVALCAAASLVYAAVDFRRGRAAGEEPPELLSLSAVAAVMLLVVYHRFYDAVFLVIPLVLCLTMLRRGERGGWLILVPLLAFFAPGASVLSLAGERGYIPAPLASATWWNVLVVQHQTWALCALLASLILLRAASQSEPRA